MVRPICVCSLELVLLVAPQDPPNVCIAGLVLSREHLAIDDTWTAPEDTSEGYGQGAIDLLSEWAAVARGETNGAECTVPPDAMLKVAQLLDAV